MALSALSVDLTATLAASARQAVPGTLVSGNGIASYPAPEVAVAFALAFGAGSGNANKLVRQYRQLAASAAETLNLLDGSLLDVFGVAAAFGTVRAFAVVPVANPSGATASTGLTLAAGASNGWAGYFGGGTVPVPAGGVPYLAGSAAGVAVDATHKNVTVTNADGTHLLTFLLLVAGE